MGYKDQILTPKPKKLGPYLDVTVKAFDPSADAARVFAGGHKTFDFVWALVGGLVYYEATGAAANRYIQFGNYGSLGAPDVYTQGIFQSVTAITAGNSGGLMVGPANPDSAMIGPVAVHTTDDFLSIPVEGIIISGPNDYIFVGGTGSQAGDICRAQLRFKYLNRQIGMYDPFDEYERQAI